MLVQFAIGLIQKEVCKEEDVLAAVFQLRHAQGEFIDAVVEILAECTFFDGLFQILVGGGDQPHVYLYLFVGADGAHLASCRARSSCICTS